MGLVDEVTLHDQLLEDAVALAGELSANAPLGVRLAKQFINRDQDAPGITESMEATALLFATEDYREGVSAFLEDGIPISRAAEARHG